MKDEIVEEVRRVRDEFAAKYNYDIAAICAAIRELQNARGREVVTRQPRLPKPVLVVEAQEQIRKVA